MATRVTDDDFKLAQLGVERSFKRGLNTFSNFAIAFSIICVPATITSALQLAWASGGPAAAIHGWVIVSLASLFLGLSMAEIVSALPSCGGPFFWSSVLAGKHGPYLGWVTGWFNLLGQVSIVAAAADAVVTLLATMLSLGLEITLTQPQQLGVYAGCLILAGVINSMPGRFLASFSSLSFFVIFSSIIFLVLLLPAVAPWHQSARFVWATFDDHNKSPSGITNNAYLFLEGTMMAQYCIIGYDCCAHMSEETRGAQKSAPLAIIMAIVSSSVLGYAFLLALMFCIQDPGNLLTGNAAGYVAAQIIYDVFMARYDNGLAAVAVMTVPLLMMVLCLVACMLSGSRMLYSFARASGLPKLFGHVSEKTHTPLRAIWVLALASFVLGLPLLKSLSAFLAVVSITNIGLLISYAIPIACRHTIARKRFVPGPFHLGRYSFAIGLAAVAWTITASVVFVLPAAYPVTTLNFNFAPVAVAAILIGSLVAWHLPRWGAKYYFTGPRVAAEIFSLYHKIETMP